MSAASTSAKPRPSLDESTFQQLLAAAFVVQQHNDGLRASDPAQATSGVLTEIAEIQSLVRAGGLDLTTAARLVADRLRKITRADGVRIEFLSGSEFKCIAETGTPLKTSPIIRSLVAMEHLRQGDLFQSSDTQTDVRLGPSSIHDSSMRTLIVAPIHSLTDFAGFVEIHWARVHASHESDARACSLMAGLVSGILERSAKAQARGQVSAAPAGEIPPLPSAGDSPSHEEAPRHDPAGSGNSDEIVLQPVAASPASADGSQALPSHCRVCGRPFGADEVFCGQCSMPRVAGAPSENLQGKWASLWYMQQAQAKSQHRPNELPAPAPVESQPAQKAQQEPHSSPPSIATPSRRLWQIPGSTVRSNSSPNPTLGSTEPANAIKTPQPNVAEGNEAISPASPASPAGPVRLPHLFRRTWSAVWPRIRERSLTWLVGATGLLLLLLVLAVWPSQNPQLTWLQSVLVQLGLADVPPPHPVVVTGNPSANVWVDVHTALYYCEGSDLYGKTPGGYYATQHDAQRDQFEAAARTPCP